MNTYDSCLALKLLIEMCSMHLKKSDYVKPFRQLSKRVEPDSICLLESSP